MSTAPVAHAETSYVKAPKHVVPPFTTHSTPSLEHLLDFSGKTVYNDFRDGEYGLQPVLVIIRAWSSIANADLVRDGFCVIKNVISKEKAAETVDEIHQWLEDFNLGYKRDDPSTIREECLPVIHQKGLIQAYGAPHEVRFRGHNLQSYPFLKKIDSELYLENTWRPRCHRRLRKALPNRRPVDQL